MRTSPPNPLTTPPHFVGRGGKRVALWLIAAVGVALAGWATLFALNVINAPDVRWFADEPRVAGSCEAAAWLKSVGASRVAGRDTGNPAISIEEALANARAAVTAGYPDAANVITSQPIRVRGRLSADGEQSAWVVVAQVAQTAPLSHAAIVVIDDASGEVITLMGIAGAVDPNSESACPPPTMRALARQIGLSAPVIALGGYVAVVAIVGIGVWVVRRKR